MMNKHVTFTENKPKIRFLRAWAFAAHQCRVNDEFLVEQCDRLRFQRRIKLTSTTIEWVLQQPHRDNIYKMRFASQL